MREYIEEAGMPEKKPGEETITPQPTTSSADDD
jgi:hypothetical protein